MKYVVKYLNEQLLYHPIDELWEYIYFELEIDLMIMLKSLMFRFYLKNLNDVHQSMNQYDLLDYR
jgi:hypothetical protein